MALTNKLTAIAGAFILAVGSATANEDGATATHEEMAPVAERPLFANPFDASTWFDAGGEMDHAEMGAPEKFNMAHPSFWLSFVTPETHSKRHMQFTNPATYAQFMDPSFYMNFANPSNWVAWINPTNYEVLAKADTYTYWMQPGAYMHATKPDGYMQMFDLENYTAFISPDVYMKWMDPSVYDFSEAATAMSDATEFLNPSNVLGYMLGALSTES